MDKKARPDKSAQPPQSMEREGGGMAENGSNTPQPAGIIVVGEGKITALSNRIVLTLAVESRGASAMQAHDEMTQRTQHLMRVLMEQGLDHADMQTAWMGAHPIMPQSGVPLGFSPASYPPVPGPQNASANWGANPLPNMPGSYAGLGVAQTPPSPQASGLPHGGGYAAGGWLRVTVREPHRLGELLDTAASAGASFCAGIAAGIEDEAALQRVALQSAAQDAWAKAELLAQLANRRLGQVLSLVEELLPPNTQPVAGATNSSTEITFRVRVHATFAWS